MNNYPAIKNILISIFSVDVGLEESEEAAMLERILIDSTQRKEIEDELVRLYQDDSVSWVDLLDNNEYVVYPADDDEDAKEYVTESLWNKVFPSRAAP